MTTSADRAPEAARLVVHLRDEILDGLRLPGERLVERDLAEELGTSRVPVRDALKALAAEGLVTLRPRTWAVVREFSAQDVEDLRQVRAAIEPLAFRLAVRRRDAGQQGRLREIVAAELDAARAGDAVRARRAAADFHEEVLAISGNAVLAELGRLTGSRMRWFMSQHDDLLAVAAQHGALCEAVAVQDEPLMERLVAEHLRTSEELLRARADFGIPSRACRR